MLILNLQQKKKPYLRDSFLILYSVPYSSSSLNYFLIHLFGTLSTPYIPRFQLHCLMMAEFVSSQKFKTLFLSELHLNFQTPYNSFIIILSEFLYCYIENVSLIREIISKGKLDTNNILSAALELKLESKC